MQKRHITCSKAGSPWVRSFSKWRSKKGGQHITVDLCCKPSAKCQVLIHMPLNEGPAESGDLRQMVYRDVEEATVEGFMQRIEGLQKIRKPDFRVDVHAAFQSLSASFQEFYRAGALFFRVVDKGPRDHDQPLQKLLVLRFLRIEPEDLPRLMSLVESSRVKELYPQIKVLLIGYFVFQFQRRIHDSASFLHLYTH